MLDSLDSLVKRILKIGLAHGFKSAVGDGRKDGITNFFKDKDNVHVIISTTSTPHNERFQYEYQYWTAAAQSFSTAAVFTSMVSSCSMFLLRQVRVVLSSSATLMA